MTPVGSHSPTRTPSMGLSSGAWQSRWAIFALLSVLVLFVSFVVMPNWQPVHAQEGAAEGGATDQGQAESSNIFRHIIKSAFEVKSGAFIFGMMLVFTSIGLFALIVLLAMDLRMTTCIPPIFVEEFTDTVNKRRFKEAFDLARNDSSFLGRILTAGLRRLQLGLQAARVAAFISLERVEIATALPITRCASISRTRRSGSHGADGCRTGDVSKR